MAARSETFHFADDKGRPIIDAKCEGYRADTKALLDTDYTDKNGDVTLDALLVGVDALIYVYHHGKADFLYNYAPPDLSEVTGDLDDIDDGTTYGRISVEDITSHRVDYDKMQDGTTYKRVLDANLTAEGLFLQAKISGAGVLATADDLGDVPDGGGYERVLGANLTAEGLFLLNKTSGDATHRIVTDTEKGTWDGKPDDMDDIGDGSTYGKIHKADITAYSVKLSSTVESASANYVTNNEKTGASDGYDFFESKLTAYGLSIKSSVSTTRVEMTATHVAGYASNVLQFELKASDGKAYFGGGSCLIDSAGISIGAGEQKFILLGDSSYKSYIYGYGTNNRDIRILPSNKLQVAGDIMTGTGYNIWPQSNNNATLGDATHMWAAVYTKIVTLGEVDTADSGHLYTTSANKLYFQDGASVVHEVAFV